MKKLAPVAQRNRKGLVHMHAAHGIANQPVCYSWRNPASSIRGLLARTRIALKHTADDATQEPQAPGKHQKPEQKTYYASEKVHWNQCLPTGPLAQYRRKPL